MHTKTACKTEHSTTIKTHCAPGPEIYAAKQVQGLSVLITRTNDVKIE
jgi:hypothetical protein